ncbi:hypothetical protein DPEC_G00333530 [Dallia pectoralis]|uniref:Uncharacterized protein n=1 Tax=Dallia pectoralis TaxID=75939 RepID=A0ACC2F6I0_DALPE|nr:hypothetical protein DPEC_G00333530 [Dallia pectoralis]
MTGKDPTAVLDCAHQLREVGDMLVYDILDWRSKLWEILTKHYKNIIKVSLEWLLVVLDGPGHSKVAGSPYNGEWPVNM